MVSTQKSVIYVLRLIPDGKYLVVKELFRIETLHSTNSCSLQHFPLVLSFMFQFLKLQTNSWGFFVLFSSPVRLFKICKGVFGRLLNLVDNPEFSRCWLDIVFLLNVSRIFFQCHF